MTVSQIMNRFSKFGEGKIPVEELAEAARQKDTITPLLLKNLDDVYRKVQGKEYEEIDWDDPDFELFMYSCYLLSQFQEQRAFPKLMRFLTLDFALMDAVFMESTIDQLCQFLYSTYNGDLVDAKRYAGDPEVHDYLREELIRFMSALVQNGRMDRDEFRDCLRQWISDFDPETDEEGIIPSSLASAIYWGNYPELIPEAEKLFEAEYTEEYLSYGEFRNCMAGKGSITNPAHQIVNTAEELRSWGCFSDGSPFGFF